MAGSVVEGNFGFKTLNLHEKKDPLKNLWRNVLIVGIEDLLKKKEIQIKFNVQQKYSMEEMWFDHEDFDLVCEYSELAPKIVRKRVFEAIERMKNKYVNKRNMSEMPGQWFYKSEGINREPNRHSTTMYDV
jgi:hypothetical protein